MIDVSDAKQIMGKHLSTTDGTALGKIGQVYLDEFHGQPEWVTVNTGLFGTNESFVPLAEATLLDDGLSVPYTKDQIKNAPNIDDSGHLTEAEEQDLYRHYNIPFTTEGSTFADLSGTARTQSQPAPAAAPVADDAMTRSEERLNVGTETVQTGKARLHKWIETETVQVDVPIRREKARLVTEPITDANRASSMDGPDITENEYEIVLNEERPVVSKETVAVERVRLEKEVVEGTQTVSDDVRKERIEFDDNASSQTPTSKKRR